MAVKAVSVGRCIGVLHTWGLCHAENTDPVVILVVGIGVMNTNVIIIDVV
jgi:tRNA A-37 threonylcarbamoyl transferase component Bud32